ncbi:MAG TPA: hypothetical protein P5026_10735 [Kiritimatiellia bacterium]|nr:hypothetical protein [Kiritimatiellia bacterium]HRU71394.1 hypothetical protein [Kiritimatiellia bacterium]
MCSSAPKVPKAPAPTEPMKQAAARSAEASDAAARDAALRRGLASTYTRFDTGTTQTQTQATIGG